MCAQVRKLKVCNNLRSNSRSDLHSYLRVLASRVKDGENQVSPRHNHRLTAKTTFKTKPQTAIVGAVFALELEDKEDRHNMDFTINSYKRRSRNRCLPNQAHKIVLASCEHSFTRNRLKVDLSRPNKPAISLGDLPSAPYHTLAKRCSSGDNFFHHASGMRLR